MAVDCPNTCPSCGKTKQEIIDAWSGETCLGELTDPRDPQCIRGILRADLNKPRRPI